MIITLSLQEIEFLTLKAKEKVEMESWGARTEQKIQNFANSFITEEAFKKLLAQNKIWCRYRGLYVGDAEGAGVDFTVKQNNQETSIGLRSIDKESLEKWKSVAYPNDRFETEKEKIADYIVVCYRENNYITFIGWIKKNEFLSQLNNSQIKLSFKNREKFRTVSLENFNPNINTLIQTFEQS